MIDLLQSLALYIGYNSLVQFHLAASTNSRLHGKDSMNMVGPEVRSTRVLAAARDAGKPAACQRMPADQ